MTCSSSALRLALGRRVEHLGELLLERGAALVLAAGELGLDDAAHGEQVDAWLRVEAVVFGGDEGAGEVARDVRARVGDAVLAGLLLRERGGLARGRGDDVEHAGGEGEHDCERGQGDGGALEVAALAAAAAGRPLEARRLAWLPWLAWLAWLPGGLGQRAGVTRDVVRCAAVRCPPDHVFPSPLAPVV